MTSQVILAIDAISVFPFDAMLKKIFKDQIKSMESFLS